MSEAAKELRSEDSRVKLIQVAGLETEAKENRPTEVFRSNYITVNLPEDPSEQRSSIVFHAARN
ncbi:MAG TPA: hypothetical protein VGK02_11160 [Candidatus Aquicultor sp.]|jgi:hypothetical protein